MMSHAKQIRFDSILGVDPRAAVCKCDKSADYSVYFFPSVLRNNVCVLAIAISAGDGNSALCGTKKVEVYFESFKVVDQASCEYAVSSKVDLGIPIR